MAVFALGPFNFVRLNTVGLIGGIPEGMEERTAITQRPGVQGTGIILMARKARPFAIETFVDVDTYAAGANLVQSYRSIVGQGLFGLVLRDVNYFLSYSLKFAVLSLQSPRVRPLGASSGGLSASAGAGVWATWGLVAVEGL